MPTTRRSSSGRAAVATGKQSRLSFSNRVTKPVPKSAKDSVVAASSPLKKELVHQPKVEKDDDDDHDKEAVDDEISVKADEQLQRETEQQIVHVDVTKSDAELKAAKLGDAAVQKYWRKVEAERMSKRVHQEDLTLSEKVLRYFDVSSQYGPCIGISRLRRWQRAQRLGLNPPVEVLAVLLKEEAKGNKGIERAHMEQIMNNTSTGL